LVEKLPVLAQAVGDSAPRFQILTGTNALYPFLAEMVGRAQEEVMVMITQRALRDSARFGLQHQVGRFLRRGGRFRLLVESDVRVRSLLTRFEQLAREFPRASLRHLLPQPARLTIVDRSEVLLFLVPEARAGSIDEIAVWTDNQEFVRSQRLYFDSTWDRAGSASLTAPQPVSPSRQKAKLRAAWAN
jgi:hypothetical protein